MSEEILTSFKCPWKGNFVSTFADYLGYKIEDMFSFMSEFHVPQYFHITSDRCKDKVCVVYGFVSS